MTQEENRLLKSPHKHSPEKCNTTMADKGLLDRYVTFTATIAMAFQRDAQDLQNELIVKQRAPVNHKNSKNKTISAPKPKHYFHTEYAILPDKTNEATERRSKTETDIVTYGIACKIFRDGETTLIRTYDNPSEDKCWFIYKVRHILKINDEALETLYKNKVVYKVWDAKERCIPRARFEKPRAFRFADRSTPSSPTSSRPSTPTSQNLTIDEDYPYSIPSRSKNPAFFPHVESMCETPVYEHRMARSKKQDKSLTILGIEHTNLAKEHDRVKNTLLTTQQQAKSVSKYEYFHHNFHSNQQTRPASANRLPHAQAEIDLSVLFSGVKDVTSRGNLNQTAVQSGSGIRDLFVTFSIDRELLSEEKKDELNPLVFHIQQLTDLPATPWSYEKLTANCKPVFCKYNFCGVEHHTHDKPHASSANFDDVKVFLVGKMNVNEIIEQFQVKPFEFQIHDRDQKTDEAFLATTTNKPILFGEDPLDLNFGKFDVSGKEVVDCSQVQKKEVVDCRGIARMCFKRLLEGQTTRLVETIPVLPASVKSSIGIPCGHYLQAGTEIRVEVTITHPLVNSDTSSLELQKAARPIQLLGFVFPQHDVHTISFIQKLKSHVTGHNISHFDCESLPEVMTTYASVGEKFASSKWFSGFHFTDGKFHALFLEAGFDLVKNLLDKFSEDLYGITVDTMYDSLLFFSSRKFDHNPILYTTKLHKPMSNILSNPKMYIEANKQLVQAVLAFWNLKTCKTLRETIKSDSMPSKFQIHLIETKIAIPVYDDGILFQKEDPVFPTHPTSETHPFSTPSPFQKHLKTSRAWTPIDHHNPEFESCQKLTASKNLVTRNKNAVHHLSNIVAEKRINSKPDATLKPYVDIPSISKYHRANSEKSLKARLTKIYNRAPSMPIYLENFDSSKNGKIPPFTRFGHKTALESNKHALVPSEDRRQELHEQWEENMLHTGKLQPTLPERDDRFEEEMKLYFQKTSLFDPTTPVSIILGGDKQADELNDVKLEDQKLWKEKLIADPVWKFCRQNSGTEQKTKLGPQFQLDKLQGLLKDEPMAEHLAKFPVHDIPALPIVDK